MDAIILKLSKRLSYRSCAPYTWHKLEDVARGYIIAVCMCDRSSRSRSSSISPVSFRWCHGFGQCKKKKKEDEENGRRGKKGKREKEKKKKKRGKKKGQGEGALWRTRRFNRDNFNARGMSDLPSGQL